MPPSPRPNLRLHCPYPASCSSEALPLGNGSLGAMVFGGERVERVLFNESTLWSGPPRRGEPVEPVLLRALRTAICDGRYLDADTFARKLQGTATKSYLPLAELELSFALPGTPEAYDRELDLESAVATTRFRAGATDYERKAFVSHPDHVAVIHLLASGSERLSFRIRLSSQLRSDVVPMPSTSGLMLLGKAPVHVEPANRDLEPAIVYSDVDGLQFALALELTVDEGQVTRSEQGVTVEGASVVTLVIAAGTSFRGYALGSGCSAEAVVRRAHHEATQALARPFSELIERHCRDHRRLFNRTSLDLGGAASSNLATDERLVPFFAEPDASPIPLLFQLGRYLLIASSRAGGQPTNPRGLWTDVLRPPAGGNNYVLSINTQMSYWPAETTHLAECAEPLLAFIGELSERGRGLARLSYGSRGWACHHSSDIWRHTAHVGGCGEEDPVSACWPMAGVWLCRHLWEHYDFGGDRDFLAIHAYPAMKQAALFLLDWLIEDDRGRLVTSPATLDMALAWELLTNCVEASSLLGIDAALRSQWEEARARLIPPAIGRQGQLLEWQQDWEPVEPQYGHLSHLFGVYPGEQITRARFPERLLAARRSLELSGNSGPAWSLAWKANLWARLGEGDRALAFLSHSVCSTAGSETDGAELAPALLETHALFPIDTWLGLTAAIVEMLLQSHGGEIALLPALPRAWHTGSFRGLRARGGFEVDVTWREAQLVRAEIRSLRGGMCRLRTEVAVTIRSEGRAVRPERPRPLVVEFMTAAARSYVIEAL